MAVIRRACPMCTEECATLAQRRDIPLPPLAILPGQFGQAANVVEKFRAISIDHIVGAEGADHSALE